MKKRTTKTIMTATLATTLAAGFVLPTFAQSLETQPEPTITDTVTSQIQAKNIKISEVKVAPSVEPGQPFPITFRVENISSGTIYGLSLKLTNVEGKATLDPFMPVGTTNEIYVGKIGYQDVREITMTLQSSPLIKDGVYNFNTSVMYSVGNQAEEEITKTIGVMVQNTANVSLTGVQVVDGMLTATLMNEGVTKIRQAKATLTVNGEIYEQTLGNVDSESEGYLSMGLPVVQTDTPATVVVTYQDATGVTQTLEASTTILATSEMTTQPDQPEPQGFWDKIKSFFGFGVK